MKKLIALSAVFLTVAFTLTSCGDKKADTEVVTETEVVETPADTVVKTEVDTVAIDTTAKVIEKK
jgi:hypothetical protein